MPRDTSSANYARRSGTKPFDGLRLLLDTLGDDEQPRMSDYLRSARDPAH